jgi:hypothetical protein
MRIFCGLMSLEQKHATDTEGTITTAPNNDYRRGRLEGRTHARFEVTKDNLRRRREVTKNGAWGRRGNVEKKGFTGG